MHVYVQKSTSTTLPRNPSGVSGSELSHPVAPSKAGRLPSTCDGCRRLNRLTRRAPRALPRSSANRLERCTQLGGKELRLLPGREVPALVDRVEVDDIGIGLLDPAARGPPDLARERRERERDRRRGQRLGARGRRVRPVSLPVRTGRRGSGARQPVERDVVEDVVTGQIPRGLVLDEGAR